MKNIMKLTFGLVLSLAAVSSCVKEVIEPSPVPEGAQAYFSSQESSVVSLANGQNKVTVNVYRANTEGAISIGVSFSDDSQQNIFRGGDKVEFADGSDVASFDISFDFNRIESDVEYPVSLKLENNTTPYGSDNLSLIIKYAPWTPWAPYNVGDATGVGDYTYSAFFSGDDPGLDILYTQSILDPTKYQFKIEGCMYGISLVFDYDATTGKCHVPDTYTGYNHSSYGPVYACEVKDYDPSASDESYFDSEAGIFYLNLIYYVDAGYFGKGYEKFALHGFYVPDYNLSMQYLGRLVEAKTGKNYAITDITIGEKGTSPDIDSVKYVLLEGELSEEEVAEYIISGGEGVLATAKTGQYRIPFPEETASSDFTIGAIAFDIDGYPVAVVVENIEEFIGGNPWQSIGFCDYTDDIIAPLFGSPIVTYSVEVLVNENKPGVYRMKNPYGEGYPYSGPGTFDPDDITFVDVDASDPEMVFFNSSLGADFGYGVMAARALAPGTLVDGVITFPVKGLACSDDDGSYYANRNGAFRLDVGHPYAEPKEPVFAEEEEAASRQEIAEKYSPRAAKSVYVSKFVNSVLQ